MVKVVPTIHEIRQVGFTDFQPHHLTQAELISSPHNADRTWGEEHVSALSGSLCTTHSGQPYSTP